MSPNDSMLDVYIYENVQLLEKLESVLLICEKNESFSTDQVANIFRILHTIKGSSAMMNFDNISNLSHALEDLFDYLREHKTRKQDHHKICDLTLMTLDIINSEVSKIQNNGLPDSDVTENIKKIEDFYKVLTQRKAPITVPQSESIDTLSKFSDSNVSITDGQFYCAKVLFEKDCKMENVRALGVVKSIEDLCSTIVTLPNDLLKEHSDDEIILNGLTLYIVSKEPKDILLKKLKQTFFVQKLEFEELDATQPEVFKLFNINSSTSKKSDTNFMASTVETSNIVKQNYMSVNLEKLDALLDIVGEIVITESTVTKNPEILKLQIDSFKRASRQLGKLTDELQNIVMSIRMVPVSTTFHKMERIVRDMSSKVNKKANLIIIGEDTELDKNILDNLSDPLIHMIRNSMDHGLESADERIKKNKNPIGNITLEARNTGRDVMIIISDDGRGLNKDELIEKGIEKGIITKPKSEVLDSEAYALIFAAGFSTKKEITEFSGRGVGMDVALKNIEKVGGSISVDSTPGICMSVQVRIPLTLAIIDGMQVSVGSSSYIVPLLSIKESFKPNLKDIFTDPGGNEIIHVRGNCYPIIRLHKTFAVATEITSFENGILVMVEARAQTYCLFVDNLIGVQKTVVKPMPVYFTKTLGGIKSIAGCTILGDGNISLILDINGVLY